MNISRVKFGTTEEGKEVFLYTVKNSNGMIMKVTDYGANLTALYVPDRNGKKEDVVLGYDTLAGYLVNGPNFGSIIGRNANRISKGVFTLNGVEYQLDQNDGTNNLHSGFNGYHRRLWEADAHMDERGGAVELSLHSPDKDQGYPGDLELTVTYILTPDNSVLIEYHAAADQDTVANFTNHSYFNLAGHGSGTVLEQKVWINADSFTVSNNEFIPTGEIRSVKNTPMDFTEMKPIGRDIASTFNQIADAGGFDHNWVLNKQDGDTVLAARMEDERSGRGMEVYTDMPGMQFYTANFMDGHDTGKDGVSYGKNAGACFETQYYPDAINIPSFPQPVLKAGDTYESTTIYRFYLC